MTETNTTESIHKARKRVRKAEKKSDMNSKHLPAIDVGDLTVQAKLLLNSKILRCKRFVDLDAVPHIDRLDFVFDASNR